MISSALSLARSVFAPVAFALLVMAVAWPFQRRLQAVLPKLLAVAIGLTMTTAVLMVFASAIAWSFSRIIRYVINDATRLQVLYGQAAGWLDTHGIVLAGLWAEHFDVRWLIRVLPEAINRVNDMATFVVVVIIYVILGLIEVDDVTEKLKANGRESGQVLLARGARTAAKLRWYMLVRTPMRVMTGVLVWAFVAFAGLELALEWGVIALILNYIPVIGPRGATVFPTLFAMA